MTHAPADSYGVLASALTGLRVYEQAARRSGRTMRLLEQVQDGDRIITTNVEADRIRRELGQMGKHRVEVVALSIDADPRRYSTLPRGRTFFDHMFVHAFMVRACEDAAGYLDRMQAAMSKTWPEPLKVDPEEVLPVTMAEHYAFHTRDRRG